MFRAGAFRSNSFQCSSGTVLCRNQFLTRSFGTPRSEAIWLRPQLVINSEKLRIFLSVVNITDIVKVINADA